MVRVSLGPTPPPVRLPSPRREQPKPERPSPPPPVPDPICGYAPPPPPKMDPPPSPPKMGPPPPPQKMYPPPPLPPPPPKMDPPKMGPPPKADPRPPPPKLDPPPPPMAPPPPPPPKPYPYPPVCLPQPSPLDSSWIIFIREKINKAQQYKDSSPWATQSIYRVPKSLREVDETAYTPKIVSLGPYHSERLQDMSPHKWRALHQALTRAKHDVHHQVLTRSNLDDFRRDLDRYLEAVREQEVRARACYDIFFPVSSEAFVLSLVLDAIFTLELFRGVAGEGGFKKLGYDPEDPVFSISGAIRLQSDMIMLENQLPLFVLDIILALQLDHEPSQSGFVASLALGFFYELRPTNQYSAEPDSDGALHCLDVFRRSLILEDPEPDSSPCIQRRSSHERPVADKPRLQLIHSVTELRDAGFEFRHRENHRVWDIMFKDCVLHIPSLIIRDGTKSLFHNLIAFEECHFDCSDRITSYVIFMGNLIKSEVDVRYLRNRKIIKNFLGNDKEVVDLFNQLCQEVSFDLNKSYISKLLEQVDEYYKKTPITRPNYYKVKWQKWKAILRQQHLSSPWAIISLIAAVFLLLLTAGQTFYAVYGYYEPNN